MIGDIKKFRFWCQKVIPLVYDNSLSYYEVLCKVVDYLNKVIEDMNEIPTYIDAKIEEALDDEHIKELIEEVVANIESAISSNNEHDNTNSSADYNIGQILWWNGKLYKVIRQIDAGDTFIVDTNIELVNFEDLFNDFVDEVKHDITANDDGSNTTASQNWTAGDWLWLNDVLYIVTSDITQGNAYVFSGDNANVEEITIEDAIKVIKTDITNLNTDLGNETDARIAADNDITNMINILSSGAIKTCVNRNSVHSVNAELGQYILATNAYQTDGIKSLYKVTNGTADGYFNIALDNGNTAELIYDTVVYAHQVGAYPDGNDCCDAINAIIDNVAPVVIKFGVGRYTFDDRIWLNSNQSIEGVGNETILYISQDPILNHGEFIGIIGTSDNIKENIALKNFAIDVYVLAITDPTEDVNPIGVSHAKHILVDNIKVLRSNWRGMQFEGGTLEDITVSNCCIENVYQNSISFMHVANGYIKDVRVENLRTKGFNSIASILVSTSDTDIAPNMENIVFEDIYIDGTDSTVRPVYLLRAKNVTLNNIYCRNCLNNATNMQFQNCENIILDGVNNSVSAVASGGSGVGIVGNCDNILMSDLILNNFNVGVAISTTVGNNSNIGIKALTVTNAGLNGINITDANVKGYSIGTLSNKTNYNASANFTIS